MRRGLVHPQLVYTSLSDLCNLWPWEVTTDQSCSSDQPDQSQKTEKPERDPKNRLSLNTKISDANLGAIKSS